MARRDPRLGDMFADAPPGHSLTSDNTQWPWGQPPQDADPEVALEKAIARLKKPKIKQELLKLFLVGVSIEVIVEGIIFTGFQEGLFSVDAGMLMKPSLAIFLANMAEEEKIPYRLFENDDAGMEDEMDDDTFFRMMKDNNPRMFDMIRENVNAAIREGTKPREPEERGFLTQRGGAE